MNDSLLHTRQLSHRYYIIYELAFLKDDARHHPCGCFVSRYEYIYIYFCNAFPILFSIYSFPRIYIIHRLKVRSHSPLSLYIDSRVYIAYRVCNKTHCISVRRVAGNFYIYINRERVYKYTKDSYSLGFLSLVRSLHRRVLKCRFITLFSLATH